MKLYKILIFLCLLSSSCHAQSEKPVIVFIHGTLPRPVAWLVHKVDCPLGLTNAQAWGESFVLGKIPYILHRADPKIFDVKSFYLFGWSGKLCFEERKEAAHNLYHYLKQFKNREIILIAHSHGCNVALNLAGIARKHNDNNLCISKLILLAGPVQAVTSEFVNWPLFKRVYSLYSSADLLQVMDPQAMYDKTKKYNNRFQKNNSNFFSCRTFKPSSNLVQARIFLNGSSPSHTVFVHDRFLKRLPDIITFLDTLSPNHGQYMINVPYAAQPHIITRQELTRTIGRHRQKSLNRLKNNYRKN